MSPTLASGSGSSTIAGLAVLMALFALAIWILKRAQSPRLSRSKHLSVLATQPIGPGQQLLIVRAGEQTLLIGASTQSVNLITAIDTLPAELPVSAGQRMSSETRTWSHLLSGLVRR